nr:MAG TPA: hypothetical protein [Caudoviricetes sp.]
MCSHIFVSHLLLNELQKYVSFLRVVCEYNKI